MVPAALPPTPDNTTKSSNTEPLPFSRPLQQQTTNHHPAAIFFTTSSNLLFIDLCIRTSLYVIFVLLYPPPPYPIHLPTPTPPTTSFTHITLLAHPYSTCFRSTEEGLGPKYILSDPLTSSRMQRYELRQLPQERERDVVGNDKGRGSKKNPNPNPNSKP